MGSTKMKERGEEKNSEEKKQDKPKAHVPKIEIREIVRVSGTDLDGSKSLIRALGKIKGISYAMSKAICASSEFEPKTRLGSMNEQDIRKVEQVIKDPIAFGIPRWMINRRFDFETGKDLHLSGQDLDVVRKFDVQRMIDAKSYKGVRHMYGLPVRGQRTRSHFRKGRTVGVVRKEVRVAMAKAGGEEKKEEKK